jgi:hypothetical protein
MHIPKNFGVMAALAALVGVGGLAPEMRAAAHTPQFVTEGRCRGRKGTKTKKRGGGGVSSHRKLKIKYHMSK